MIYRGRRIRFGSLPYPLLPVFLCVAGWAYWREGGRGRGRTQFTNQFIWPRESRSLFKSFNTLCLRPCSILPLCKLFLCIVFPLVFFLKLALSYLWCFKVFSKRVFRIPSLFGKAPDPCIQTTELWIRIILFFFCAFLAVFSLFFSCCCYWA